VKFIKIKIFMKKKNIYQLLAVITLLVLIIPGCEETVWPDVVPVNKSEYLGSWTAPAYRAKTTYIRTQDLVTKDFSARDTTVTDSVTMKFELGIARASGVMVEDSVKITSTLTKNGVAQTPVVRSGYYSLAGTSGSDYTGSVVYLNVWERTANMHTGFANPIAEPYTTYTVMKKSSNEMDLSWVLYNNTSQNSVRYQVNLKK
jgi:uncharacterized lipoprotein NlpE involved in copper resistance